MGNATAKAEPAERVRIWNTFLKLAWAQAKSLREVTKGQEVSKEFNPLGGTLPPDEFSRLATLVLCALAIEARANHLIAEAQEKGKLTENAAEAVRWLRAEQKWLLLPTLWKRRKRIDPGRLPHQAIMQICKHRNDLLHVNYTKLKAGLPSPEQSLILFENFTKAIEDMNVLLGR